ncbi:bifunctional diaminohydroxyphosphoribosylaminopyrimidine deaminase/5-amino-6-(5-phosphoribosylamino)uracil reductase RibD [Actinomadura sp. NPDC047616]|uniref:bifunctional diaminohydroxyphosphoribosylaminopyrimidine deaminase/5-amino-6-(5-phosphoribosylamino)uracil reductase RibD n=1 Tax=Actinomadura sp. NPDC047616 TaxID=3155914 RepID=UPI0033FB4644
MAVDGEVAAVRRAIALSALGLGSTSPNPPVGCVILDLNGNVAGEGYHLRKGRPHAEANALAAAGPRGQGGTAVVTLEPCCHHGRTPPCHQALLDAGIARVVVALIDPTSRDDGGVAKLRAEGVDVEVGVLADEARIVLGPWLHALHTRRPHVTWGRLAASSPELAALRVGVDAVLRGTGRVEEGRPGAHAPDVFQLHDVDMATGPHAVLESLYGQGVRSVLLDADDVVAGAWLAAGLVDRLVAHTADQGPSSPGKACPLPEGFALVSTTRVASGALVEARKTR